MFKYRSESWDFASPFVSFRKNKYIHVWYKLNISIAGGTPIAVCEVQQFQSLYKAKTVALKVLYFANKYRSTVCFKASYTLKTIIFGDGVLTKESPFLYQDDLQSTRIMNGFFVCVLFTSRSTIINTYRDTSHIYISISNWYMPTTIFIRLHLQHILDN